MTTEMVSGAFLVFKVRDQNCSTVMFVIDKKSGNKDLVMVYVNTDLVIFLIKKNLTY